MDRWIMMKDLVLENIGIYCPDRCDIGALGIFIHLIYWVIVLRFYGRPCFEPGFLNYVFEILSLWMWTFYLYDDFMCCNFHYLHDYLYDVACWVEGVTFSGIRAGRTFRSCVLCAFYVSFVYSDDCCVLLCDCVRFVWLFMSIFIVVFKLLLVSSCVITWDCLMCMRWPVSLMHAIPWIQLLSHELWDWPPL